MDALLASVFRLHASRVFIKVQRLKLTVQFLELGIRLVLILFIVCVSFIK